MTAHFEHDPLETLVETLRVKTEFVQSQLTEIIKRIKIDTQNNSIVWSRPTVLQNKKSKYSLFTFLGLDDKHTYAFWQCVNADNDIEIALTIDGAWVSRDEAQLSDLYTLALNKMPTNSTDIDKIVDFLQETAIKHS